jgi:hypothetical protein
MHQVNKMLVKMVHRKKRKVVVVKKVAKKQRKKKQQRLQLQKLRLTKIKYNHNDIRLFFVCSFVI